ncbi:CoA-transferase family III [Gonapodya prolifera JEL478]|uniref:CoA-transferase family III n=1 Tax=Gonapodya prolifera (strain JEL478) TaxID=1344416 RepID=A0A139AYF4_GONPJ|nr:CoA-transferase family III [Gonapodya prolifera JEL478]|eukprot:KXS21778.1 CoA-transferase family III [Gonapodya prolifera JEL478]
MSVDIYKDGRRAAALLLNQLGYANDVEAQRFLDGVKLVGNRSEAYIPSCFKLQEEAVGIQLAVATVLQKLSVLKYGRPQTVSLDSDHAILTMMAPYLVNVDGVEFIKFNTDWEEGPEAPKAQRFRFLYNNIYPTADNRWIYLNAKFDNTRVLLSHLGFGDQEIELLHRLTREDPERFIQMIQHKTKQQVAADLEQRMNKHHHVAVASMDRAKFDASEHGRIINTYPFIEVDPILHPIRPSDPFAWKRTPLPQGSRGTNPPQILDGIKVVEIARILAGPKAGTFLASMGARVVKVQSPNLEDMPPYGIDTQIGKRSIFLDLKNKQERETLKDMILDADVVIQNYAYGALDRLGFGPQHCAEIVKNRDRGLIYVQSNCFGFHGPLAPNPGFDALGQMVTGIHSAMENFAPYDPAPPLGDSMPTPIPFPVCDLSTAQFCALGVLVALHRRALYGGSYVVQSSLTQAALYVQAVGQYPDDVARNTFSAYPPRRAYYLEHPVYAMDLCSRQMPKIRPQTFRDEFFFKDTKSPYGVVRILKQPLQLDLTPLRYRWSTRPFGFDKDVKGFIEPPADESDSPNARL